MKSIKFLIALLVAASAFSRSDCQTLEDAGKAIVPEAWITWTPRAEIAPRTYIDTIHSKTGSSLVVAGDSNPAEFGGWQHTVSSIAPEHWYHFTASYRAEGLDSEERQIVPRLDWVNTKGIRVGQPDYVWKMLPGSDGWKTVSLDTSAPPEAAEVNIQLLLLNAPRATVWWDEIGLQAIPTPQPRKVVVTTVNLYPHRVTDPVGQFLSVLEQRLPSNADVAVLSEGISAVGTRKSFVDVAEPIPGPTTIRLGEFARKKHIYIIAGIFEREKQAVYNTAVLIDRSGNVVGKYRKVYLPREEVEGGLTAGSDYPVFQTDFGTIGIMICWDAQYPDPARALALRGAEIIFLPAWGGDEKLVKARALENHVYLVTAAYEIPTYILDPNGDVISRADTQGSVATATIDLTKRFLDPWLGDTRERFMKEIRFDVPVESETNH